MSQLQEHEETEQQSSDGDPTGDSRGGTWVRPPVALSVLVGVAVIVMNLVVILKQWVLLVPSNLSSAVFSTFIGSSLLLGVFLLVYAKYLKRAEVGAVVRGKFVRCVVTPLVVGSLAMFATVSSMTTIASLQERSSDAPKPCIQLYQQAAGIRDISPGFRMPDNDRDELRCKINQAVLR